MVIFVGKSLRIIGGVMTFNIAVAIPIPKVPSMRAKEPPITLMIAETESMARAINTKLLALILLLKPKYGIGAAKAKQIKMIVVRNPNCPTENPNWFRIAVICGEKLVMRGRELPAISNMAISSFLPTVFIGAVYVGDDSQNLPRKIYIFRSLTLWIEST
ncbi:unannotated protein [freshwater metagenome]|uniref:Unannotated protein n=1 Tax=freshwater metagenome TaxID=449393 RepID=A0A6J7HPI8_9ZZZZ